MCVMWLKLEGALIILLRLSVFLKSTTRYAVQHLAPCGQNWQKHKVFDKTSMFKTVFVCMLCLRKSLRCVSVNVSVTTIGELCDGVLAD